MNQVQSCLDRPATRWIAGLIGLLALGLAGWLVWIEIRTDPALAACVKERSAAIEASRKSGGLSAEVAQRFLARVEESCAAQLAAGGGAPQGPPTGLPAPPLPTPLPR